MTRREMLARMDSRELTEWYALYATRAKEAERARHRAESDDGQVIIYGLDDDDDDVDEESRGSDTDGG